MDHWNLVEYCFQVENLMMFSFSDFIGAESDDVI